jgi:hypothetical protein
MAKRPSHPGQAREDSRAEDLEHSLRSLASEAEAASNFADVLTRVDRDYGAREAAAFPTSISAHGGHCVK